MRLIRFMSTDEAIKLAHGSTVVNEKDHHAEGHYTNSIGFCFIIDDDTVDEAEAIHNASEYLSGIVSMDACLVAHLPNSDNEFVKGYGKYSSGMKDEMSVRRYSLNDFNLWRFYVGAEPTSAGMFFPGMFMRSSTHWEHPQLVANGGRYAKS